MLFYLYPLASLMTDGFTAVVKSSSDQIQIDCSQPELMYVMRGLPGGVDDQDPLLTDVGRELLRYLQVRHLAVTSDLVSQRNELLSRPEHRLGQSEAPLSVQIVSNGQFSEQLVAALANTGIGLDRGELSDIFVYAADYDNPSERLSFSARFVKRGTLSLLAYLDGSIVRLGPAIDPHKTACEQCLVHRANSNRLSPQPWCNDVEVIAYPATSSISLMTAVGLTAASIIHLSRRNFGACLFNRIFAIDLTTLTISENNIMRVPFCTCCGTLGTRSVSDLFDSEEFDD